MDDNATWDTIAGQLLSCIPPGAQLDPHDYAYLASFYLCANSFHQNHKERYSAFHSVLYFLIRNFIKEKGRDVLAGLPGPANIEGFVSDAITSLSSPFVTTSLNNCRKWLENNPSMLEFADILLVGYETVVGKHDEVETAAKHYRKLYQALQRAKSGEWSDRYAT